MKKLLLLSILAVVGTTAFAQKWAVTTNLAYWGTTTINLGTEVALGHHATLDVIGFYNPFEIDKYKLNWWGVQPEVRWWPCERFNGHFFGVHGHYGDYDAGGWNSSRYDGWLAGAGLGYGYQWILGKRWNFEAEIGAGYAYLEYDRYNKDSGAFIGREHKNYFGPTKLSLTFVYLIK